ncbi:MAG: biotin--[acetyl-CoA-carboxylase] ligase [Microcoleaceae cyanobacterium]
MSLNLQRLETALATLQALNPLENLIPRFTPTVANSPQSFHIQLFDILPSTNQTLWEMTSAAAPPGTVVIAVQQTAGRGQRGRVWQSQPGGLYLSWVIHPNLTVNPAQLTLCSAWGIAVMLRDRQIPVQLKWPNDLLLQDRKLGGILTETKVAQGKITHAVIGVGINWVNPTPDTGINLKTFWIQNPETATIQSLELLAALTLWGLNLGWQALSQRGIEPILAPYWELLHSNSRLAAIEAGATMGINLPPNGVLPTRKKLNRQF